MTTLRRQRKQKRPVFRGRQARRRIRYDRVVIAALILALSVFLIWKIGSFALDRFPQVAESSVVVQQPSMLGGFTVVPMAKKEPVRFKGKVQKVAYLTFDDGPSKYTNDILDVLKENKVQGTFFMVGTEIHKYPDAVKRMVEEGSYPGMHTMTHEYQTLYKSGSSANFIKEVKQEQKIIQDLTGYKPFLVRAPFGSAPQIGEKFRGDIAKAQFKLWDWTTDSLDWDLPGKPKQVIANVKRDVHKDVEVILFHEKEQTVEALPEIIKHLKKKGYKIEVYNPENHLVMNFKNDLRL